MDKPLFNINSIQQAIEELPFIKQIHSVVNKDYHIIGSVIVDFEELNKPLDFQFIIAPQYPFKTHDSDSIMFINKKLIKYNHVMEGGNICIHTSHSSNFKEKIKYDFNGLKEWIVKYYINKEVDTNYEHLVINESRVNNTNYAFIFTDCNETFIKGEYGCVDLLTLNDGVYKCENIIHNHVIQRFISVDNNKKLCQWSDYYLSRETTSRGLYIYCEEPPAVHGKFGFSNYLELKKLLSSNFLKYLHRHELDQINKGLMGRIVPLFLGYKINGKDIHWQVTLLKIGEYPIKGFKQQIPGKKNKLWITELIEQDIKWGVTKNASYNYFFGRGAFSSNLTNSKILIIGIGAVGSLIAETLTRCGCRFIDFIDYDIKEPGNVCRSTYKFSNGITAKTDELERILSEISPFIESRRLRDNYFNIIVKTFSSTKEGKIAIESELNTYDLILDCSTDNDLMYILSTLSLKGVLANISMTNHAKDMVCAFNPNCYNFVNNQFSNILNNDIKDLYEPTGCWSPTFKASYNDINILVQLTLKRLNEIISNRVDKNNFVVRDTNNEFKIIEY